MTAYAPPLADIRFVLEHLVDLEGIGRLPGLEAATLDLVDQILDEAGRFAVNELAPLNAAGDRERARLEDGARAHAPMASRRRTGSSSMAAGTACSCRRSGAARVCRGRSRPRSGRSGTAPIFAFCLCPILTQAGVELLLRHGTEAQRARYLPKLVSGEWTGTMCLTEPQAGSDVGALRTRAVPEGDHYRIYGTKIFITYGEHDYTENTIHMVLARTPDAPAGTRGISLFLIPKFLVEDDGSLGPRNDVRCVSLEHKLGIHASPTCVLSFGEEQGAIGYLVGEEQGGMPAMFTMMNNARLSVGLEGLALAERAYQAALAYARERVQGRRRNGGAEAPARIIEHPDVQRMLATMKTQIEAMRALAYTAAAELDRSLREPDARRRAAAEGRLALLIPLVKAWCTDQGFAIASSALQVHGGMGYIEETGIAQHLRDARIAMIYEGTNGIQALDLVGRKLRQAGGALPRALFAELQGDLAALAPAGVADLGPPLAAALGDLEEATRWLQAEHDNDPDAAAAGATPYLHMLATTLGGFLLARAAVRASAAGHPLAEAKLASARFYVSQLLPPAAALRAAVTAGSAPLRAALG